MTAQLRTSIPEYGIYVGTYGKYNQGNLGGAWLDPSDYSDKDEFMKACAELHKDEADPELMFQDFFNEPGDFCGECFVKESFWDWLALCTSDQELVGAYLDQSGFEFGEDSLEDAQEALIGMGTMSDVAYEWADETGLLESVPHGLECCIDWESYARDQSWYDSRYAGSDYVWRA